MTMRLWDRFYGMLKTGTVPTSCPVCGEDLEPVYGTRVCSDRCCGYVERPVEPGDPPGTKLI